MHLHTVASWQPVRSLLLVEQSLQVGHEHERVDHCGQRVVQAVHHHICVLGTATIRQHPREAHKSREGLNGVTLSKTLSFVDDDSQR